MNALQRYAFRSALLALGLFVLGTTAAVAQADGVYRKLSGKCRIGNSFGQGGPGFLPQATDRSLTVLNAASFTLQGGNGNTTGGNSSAGCGLPQSAIAVVISTSVVPRGQAGTLKIFEAGKAAADGNSVAFNTTDAITNDMIVPLRSPDVGTEITINSSRPVDYVLDVVGYFVPVTIPVAPTPDLECVSTAKTIVSVAVGTNADAFAPACSAGFIETGTYCESSSYEMPLVFINSGACSARNNTQSVRELRAVRRCCRVQ
jgi:hypothetical protein